MTLCHHTGTAPGIFVWGPQPRESEGRKFPIIVQGHISDRLCLRPPEAEAFYRF